MRAPPWCGEEVEKPTIAADTDAIVGVDSVTLRELDLHIWKGDLPELIDRWILRHEDGAIDAMPPGDDASGRKRR